VPGRGLRIVAADTALGLIAAHDEANAPNKRLVDVLLQVGGEDHNAVALLHPLEGVVDLYVCIAALRVDGDGEVDPEEIELQITGEDLGRHDLAGAAGAGEQSVTRDRTESASPPGQVAGEASGKAGDTSLRSLRYPPLMPVVATHAVR
jgi:hypothetical protein